MNMGVAKCGARAKLCPLLTARFWRPGNGTCTMTSSAEHIPAQDISILLVEDDPPTNWRLKDALEQAGFDVAAARALAGARASLEARKPRVLLTALQLPDGHGIELIRQRRAR